MISFKQFLSEAPHDNSADDFKYSPSMITAVKKDNNKAYIGEPKYSNGKAHHKKVSETPTHEIYRWDRPFNNSSNSTEFHAVDKKTGHIHMSVEGMTHNSDKKKAFEVEVLRGGYGNTIKAHEFYHHLINAGHVDSIVSDSSHSPGAKKVWHRLSQMPGVKMHVALKKSRLENNRQVISFPKQSEVNKNWQSNYNSDFNSKKYNTRFVAQIDKRK